MSSRRRRPVWAWYLGAGAVLALVVAVLLLRPGERGQLSFPPPPPDPEAPSFDGFAGAQSCAECHRTQFAAWSTSTHGRAGGEVGEAHLLRPFDGRAIHFQDASVIPLRTRSRFAFVIRREGSPPDTLWVDGVVGGGHMVGGGTQGFVTRWTDRTLRFLPFELARIEDVWFCNTATRLNQGWLPITSSMRLADCGDWPPLRVLGEQTRLATCQNCHGSQIRIEPEPGLPHATRLASLAIDCESCHGPGRAHIDAARTQMDAALPVDLHMPSLATIGEEASNTVCLACHALKDALRPGYLAGGDLESFYSLLLPVLSDAPVLADGRIRTFGYQQGHLWSDCYLAGTMTCSDCHEPHGQGYRDVNGFALGDRFADGQCTGCHASKAVEPERHTMHARGSEGSRCVSCHMPYLQEPEVGEALRYARSDHTIPVPRPAADAALGIEVACANCHAGEDVATLERQTRELWGELKPRRALVQGLLQAGDAPSREALVALLRQDPGDHDAATFLVLGTLLRDHLVPGTRLEAALRDRLQTLASHQQPDVAAAALATLHWTEGDEGAVRRQLIGRLNALTVADDVRIRRRWLVLLGFLGDRAREAGLRDRAITAYRKALELAPADAGVLANLGLTYADAGDGAAAIDAYRRSIAADSTRALTWVNLGSALAVLGDATGAENAYVAALRIDRNEPLAAFNLGNLYLRSGRIADAVRAYRAAVAADPALAPAWFNLARALVAAPDLPAAADAIRAGLEFDPDNGNARAFLEQLEGASATGGR